MDRITPSGAFGFYAGLCFLGCLFCFFCFPETAGLSLEEVQMIFRDGFGIKESERLRREKRARAIALGGKLAEREGQGSPHSDPEN